jgi:V/A-type H+/Na+-transporting ATPase subunit D
MARLNIAPTKSSLLNLKKQLAFAEEGYDLLEQKRQILVFELMKRLNRASAVEAEIANGLPRAFAALLEATLDIGSEALDRAALAVRMDHQVDLSSQRLMGLMIPRVTVRTEAFTPQFGVGGTSANTDDAMRQFVEILPRLAELAELENVVLRLARELRKTQRRCNALLKLFIPDYRETINYIMGALEERERESFIILKMLRERLGNRELVNEARMRKESS